MVNIDTIASRSYYSQEAEKKTQEATSEGEQTSIDTSPAEATEIINTIPTDSTATEKTSQETQTLESPEVHKPAVGKPKPSTIAEEQENAQIEVKEVPVQAEFPDISKPPAKTTGIIGSDAGLTVKASEASKPSPDIEDKIISKQLELEVKGAKAEDPFNRLIIGTELVGLGFLYGAYSTARGFYSIGKQAASGDVIGAGKSFVYGTIDWFRSIPSVLEAGFTESPFYAGKLSGEVAMADVLFRGTGKAIGKTGEFVAFRGKEYIPIERLTQKEVVEGKANFPLPKDPETGKVTVGRGDTIVRQFYRSKSLQQTEIGKTSEVSGFHSTSVGRGVLGLNRGFEVHSTIKRPHDTPGMYIAPDISPHFLRLSGDGGYTLLPRIRNPLKKPGVLQIGVKEVKRLPEDVRTDVSKAQEYMLTKAEKGSAYVTAEAELGKAEAEAVITPETEVVNVRGERILGGKFKYYTKWRGKKVPIYEMKVRETLGETSKIEKTGKETTGKALKKVAEEYELKGETKWIGREFMEKTSRSVYNRSEVQRFQSITQEMRSTLRELRKSNLKSTSENVVYDNLMVEEVGKSTEKLREMSAIPPFTTPLYPTTPFKTPTSTPSYIPPSEPSLTIFESFEIPPTPELSIIPPTSTSTSKSPPTKKPPVNKVFDFMDDIEKFWGESYGYMELKHRFPDAEQLLFGKGKGGIL